MKHLDDLLKNPAAAVLIVLLAMGLAGTDDFKHAKLAEKTLCEKGATKPEYCREVRK